MRKALFFPSYRVTEAGNENLASVFPIYCTLDNKPVVVNTANMKSVFRYRLKEQNKTKTHSPHFKTKGTSRLSIYARSVAIARSYVWRASRGGGDWVKIGGKSFE